MGDNKKYSDLSYEKISRVIKDVMLEDRQEKQRNIIIWTGYKGMKTFNFYLVYRLSPNKINMKIIKWRVKNKNNKLTVENYKERHIRQDIKKDKLKKKEQIKKDLQDENSWLTPHVNNYNK